MSADQLSVITNVVAKAPEWIRTDLASRDPSARRRAEEAIAAMMAAALRSRETAD